MMKNAGNPTGFRSRICVKSK